MREEIQANMVRICQAGACTCKKKEFPNKPQKSAWGSPTGLL